MAKCTKCGKEIKNTYWLNGKAYGYNCYKQELAMILAEKERLANEKYKIDVAATIEVLKNRTKLNDFLKSIVKFYEEKGFLSQKQIKCIKLSNDEQLEKILIIGLTDDKFKNNEILYNISNLLTDNTNLKDERLINMIQSFTLRSGERSSYVIRYKDLDFNKTITAMKEDVDKYKNVDYIQILDLI